MFENHTSDWGIINEVSRIVKFTKRDGRTGKANLNGSIRSGGNSVLLKGCRGGKRDNVCGRRE